MDNIDIKKYHWISPVYVIQSVVQMYKLYSEEVVTTRREFKRVEESKIAAIALLGMFDNQGIQYFMQSARDESPDILTLTLEEKPGKPVWGLYQTVEIVTYEEHSPQTDIASFLLDTKLSQEKAYDKDTVILCFVDRKIRIPTEVELHKQLQNITPKPQIVVLGRVRSTESQYCMMQIWPFAAKHVFDAAEVAKKYPQPPHMMLPKRTMDEKLQFVHTTDVKAPTLYEVFGLREEDVKKYLVKK